MTDGLLMVLDASWSSIEASLAALAESGPNGLGDDAVARLRGLGLADAASPPALSDVGERYWMARFVDQDPAQAREALADAIRQHPVVVAFCDALWGRGPRPVAGALRLVRQITKSADESMNRRWLALMNSAGLIVYNQRNPTLRVAYNPNELALEEGRKSLAHVVRPDSPFSNRLALRNVIRSASDWLWWYEQHMPGKVMEVLHAELDGQVITTVRLLSGPANVTDDLKREFASFKKEMKGVRGIDVSWRVLTKDEARDRHDRIVLSNDLAMNIPPLNTVLMGSASEFLPSAITPATFEEWWALGTDLSGYVIVAPKP